MTFFPDTHLTVHPIVFYPKGVPLDSQWHGLWSGMLTAAQQKYRAMLKDRDTFRLDEGLLVVPGDLAAAEYNHLPSDGVETILAELLLQPPLDAHDRYTLPHCLAVLMIDPRREWGPGGGRSFNGAINRGGGLFVIPHWHFDEGKLQSTTLHELGHTFGLVHVWERTEANPLPAGSPLQSCYYGQWTSPSVMSYNLQNQTNALDPAQIPGCLLGDEIDALSQNRLAFPDLVLDPAVDFDCPAILPGCPPHDGLSRAAWLGPITLFACTSPGGGDNRNAGRLNDSPDRYIPSNGAEAWEAVSEKLWKSEPAEPGGWITLDVAFPTAVTLDRIRVYSQFGSRRGRVDRVRVAAQTASGDYDRVQQVPALGADTDVCFAPVRARSWKLAFQGAEANFVIIRGLRFFYGRQELFPPEGPLARTRSGESFQSRASNLVAIQRAIRTNTAQSGFDPEAMWHSDPLPENGWAFLEIAFPQALPLTQVRVYSQHSGQFHAAQQVQVQALNADGQSEPVAGQVLAQPDASISFPVVQAQHWKLALLGQPGGYLVLRGLRFFNEGHEWYPPAEVD